MGEVIDKIAWIHTKDGKILSTLSKGKSTYYIPGGKREGDETDLETLVREVKEELLNVMGDIGFVVLDCSPLALAEGFTSITYNSLSSKQYSMLMKRMIQTFLKLKLQTVLEKAYQPPKFLFRYKRVQEALEFHIHQLLSSMNYQDSNFECIGQQGGGIDRVKLTSILN